MPLDFEKYDEKCADMTTEQLHTQWDKYTRLISSGATQTTAFGALLIYSAKISSFSILCAAPVIHNARKKRKIIEQHLQLRGTTHKTRKRHVLGSVEVSGTIGAVSAGIGSVAAETMLLHHFMDLGQAAAEVTAEVAVGTSGLAVELVHAAIQERTDGDVVTAVEKVYQTLAEEKGQRLAPPSLPVRPRSTPPV